MKFIIAQILGILVGVASLSCVQFKNEKIVLAGQFLSNVFMAGSCALLGGLAGAWICVLAAIQTLLVYRANNADAEKAEKLLSENGYMNRICNVIAIDFSDEVGGLDALLEVFAESNINLDYVYTSFHRTTQIPVVILQSEELTVSESILRKKGYRIIDNVKDFLK